MIKGSENLLIVDDQPDNLRVLASILSEQGYKVRKALNGSTALETIQIQTPDLILLDISMPQMSGYEVCTALKAVVETCEIPVIFLSGMDSAPDKVKAFAVGGADYITKPFEEEEVLARVKQQLTIQWQKQQLQQEIQERKQAQAETQLLLDTIQAVSQAADFETALHAVLRVVHAAISWDYAEAWTSTINGTVLQLNRTCCHPEDLQLQEFYAASYISTFDYNQGLPGRIWATQQPEWIDDVSQATAPMFLRSPAAKAAGLKAVFGVPIVVDGQVLAVLVFFRRDRSDFDAKLVQLVNAVALQLGGFMQRKQAEESLRQANEELQRLASVDGLTQVANRRSFNQALQQEWRRLRRECTSVSLILCDVDFFKLYNDTYGHLAGDDCLKQVAQAIARTVGRPADLVARYGGEEFVVLLPHTSAQGAAHIAEKIQSAVAEIQIAHASSQVSQVITLSMGVACSIPDSEREPENLIAAADRALYAAKASGRNRFCVDTH